jgi:hypothetical protein
MMGNEVKETSVQSENVTELGLAELRSSFGDYIKDRLNVAAGARNCAQDVISRGLLLQRRCKLALKLRDLIIRVIRPIVHVALHPARPSELRLAQN